MPDYLGVAKMALATLKKRSLVILMTSTRTENVDELLMAVKLLHGKHLVVVANLYEQDLATSLKHIPANPQDAKTGLIIRQHLDRQRTLMAQLRGLARVEVVHCTPDKLAGRLTQSYLKLRGRGW